MQPVLLRCPNTRALVQHFIADEPDTSRASEYEPFKCPACGRIHLVNGAGRLLDDEPATVKAQIRGA